MIHICYAIYDKNGRYSKFTATSMLSMFENTTVPCTVHILHDNTLTQENLEKFIYISKQYKQTVKFYNVEKLCKNQIEEFQRLLTPIFIERYSIGAFYRFLIPQVFKDFDKVIYLDSDIIINLDINELWQIEIGEKIIAAVPEIVIDINHNNGIKNHYLMSEKFVKVEDYFNSGVLVINVIKFREIHQTLKRGIQFVIEHPECELFDQDILNYCFSADYVKLSEKFDVFVNNERATNKNSEYRSAIYHYISDALTMNTQDYLNRLWFRYFKKTPYINGDIIDHLYEGVQQFNVYMKRFALRVSEMVAEKSRAFFVSPIIISAVGKLLGVKPNEEVILADSPQSLKSLTDSMKLSNHKKFFFILVDDYPIIHNALIDAGFVPGEDFIDAFAFLSESEGVPLNSHFMIKLL